jgi:aminopeptidase-like protein
MNVVLLWVLNLSDGSNSLLNISERAGLSFDDVASATGALLGKALLQSA